MLIFLLISLNAVCIAKLVLDVFVQLFVERISLRLHDKIPTNFCSVVMVYDAGNSLANLSYVYQLLVS